MRIAERQAVLFVFHLETGRVFADVVYRQQDSDLLVPHVEVYGVLVVRVPRRVQFEIIGFLCDVERLGQRRCDDNH